MDSKETRYTEYHLTNGQKVILKNPSNIRGLIVGIRMKSRTNVYDVFHGKNGEAVTKQYIISPELVTKSIDLRHNFVYDELEEKL